MRSSRQTVLILLAAGLAVLLYFAPRQASEAKQDASGNTDFTAAFEEALKNVPAEQKEIFDRLQKGLIKAQEDNSAQSWIESAGDFLKAARLAQGDNKAPLYKGAVNGFEKALALNPANLSAKTSLGTALVEGASVIGGQPMKGISLLREVVQADSNNIEAHLQLGLFSVTSQQFDKAIERFNRILRIDSTHIDMYVYLGDTYLTMGKKDKAIESYENYKTRVKDTLIIKDIDEYIKKLKTN